MRQKGKLERTGIFLKEHLTTRQHNIFYQAREARRLGHIDGVWTIDGLVWGVKGGNGRPGIMSNYEYLVDINTNTESGGNTERSENPKGGKPNLSDKVEKNNPQ